MWQIVGDFGHVAHNDMPITHELFKEINKMISKSTHLHRWVVISP
jgi:hypothetical protein